MKSNTPNQNPVTRPGGNLTTREQLEPTPSQLFPLSSRFGELLHRRFFAPAIVSLVAIVALVQAIGTPKAFNNILGVYLGLIAFYAIYLVCGRSKSSLVLICVSGMSMLVLLPLLAHETRNCDSSPSVPLLTGLSNFIILSIWATLNVGLLEELIKSVPVFVSMLIGNRSSSSSFMNRFRIADPLDGIILGAASGLGFTLVETLLKYVPEVARCSELQALQIVFPRILGGIMAHMAWSGYFGYFIGLSVLRPNRKWKTLASGFLTAAGLHGIWDGVGFSGLGGGFLIFPGILTVFLFGSALVRARQLAGLGSTTVPVSVSPLATVQLDLRVSGSSIRPSVLQVGSNPIRLSVGAKIGQLEIPGLVPISGNGIVAEINSHPNNPEVIGIMNHSINAWAVLDPQRGVQRIETGRSVRLMSGTRINFGSIFGEVH